MSRRQNELVVVAVSASSTTIARLFLILLLWNASGVIVVVVEGCGTASVHGNNNRWERLPGAELSQNEVGDDLLRSSIAKTKTWLQHYHRFSTTNESFLLPYTHRIRQELDWLDLYLSDAWGRRGRTVEDASRLEYAHNVTRYLDKWMARAEDNAELAKGQELYRKYMIYLKERKTWAKEEADFLQEVRNWHDYTIVALGEDAVANRTEADLEKLIWQRVQKELEEKLREEEEARQRKEEETRQREEDYQKQIREHDEYIAQRKKEEEEKSRKRAEERDRRKKDKDKHKHRNRSKGGGGGAWQNQLDLVLEDDRKDV